MMRNWAGFAMVAAVMLAACGGGGGDNGRTVESTSSTIGTTSPTVDETVAAASEGTSEPAATGAFSVDMESARITPDIVAEYGALGVHQVAAGAADVWVTVGDTPNEGEAFVVRHDLTGAEVARIPDDGRPLGIIVDPGGRGAWFGDNFHGTLEFVDASTNSIAITIDNAVSSLSTTLLDEGESIWSMRSTSALVRVDPGSGEIAQEIETTLASSQSDLLLDRGTLWSSDSLADTVTAFDLATGSAQTFTIPGADSMVVLEDGRILVAGDELATIDPTSRSVAAIGAVVYPDKSEFFPAKFTALEMTGSGLYGFDGVHGRFVRLDLATTSAELIDEVPIGFVGVGDIAESGDGTIWLVVTGEETETDAQDRLRRYTAARSSSG